ncbi:hypothetical protein [Streptomyces sp.]|uniref:hypothetical protein n=1 Tax=Streptomyces sp. TaxID=1931 RepID=UPI002F3FFF7B
MRTTRNALAAATAAIALVAATAGSAAADSRESGLPSARAKDRALCKRVPRIDARIDRALRRLNGPATVRGSVARLQKRVDNAAAAGNTVVETYLKDKLAFRKSLVPMLNQRSTDLDAVRTWCGTRHQGAGTPETAK